MLTAQDHARKAVALWLGGLDEASPSVVSITHWIEQSIPELAQIAYMPHFYGYLQLSFQDGELDWVGVTPKRRVVRNS